MVAHLCSAFNPSKVHTHSSEHTHTPWTHTRSSGQPFYAAAPGEQLGVRCLAQGHLSHGIEGGESAVHSLPPTIPAGPRLELATFRLRVRLFNSLESTVSPAIQLSFFKISAKDTKNTLLILVTQICVIHQSKLLSDYFFVCTLTITTKLCGFGKKKENKRCALCLLRLRELLFEIRH